MKQPYCNNSDCESPHLPCVSEILAENRRRRDEQQARRVYNPVTGVGAYGRRVKVATPVPGLPEALVPEAMTDDPAYGGASSDACAWRRLRYVYDFEYWCADVVRIKPKDGWIDAPFVLNAPQRRILAMFEDDRLANRPIRVIMLKARQWGGSTLVQMYMAWIQCVLRDNWHSLICGNTKEVASVIRAMYTKLMNNYPADCWSGDSEPRLLPFERSHSTRVVAGRGNRITIGSAENQDAVRGADYALAHLTEVAFWPSSPQHNPEDFIRAIYGSVGRQPLTMVVLESTANGVGNYFHDEWLRNTRGLGDKRTVFVPWHEIEMYSQPLESESEQYVAEWFGKLTPYELRLWLQGLTLEQINWYHLTCREYSAQCHMQAEYPGTPEEAFVNTGDNVFDPKTVEAMRGDCTVPEKRAEVALDGHIVPDRNGRMSIWEDPEKDTEYVCAVDVGGRSEGADWSVIAVLSREERPRVVAQWRGHIDHDLLGRTAAAVAHHYNTALLIIESNTLETADAAFDMNLSVLNQITRNYSNLYMRTTFDTMTNKRTRRPGFHTNRRTKPLLIHGLIAAVREHKFVERDNEALNELSTYVSLPSGIYAARPGRHDDILMTRALALHAIGDLKYTIPYWEPQSDEEAFREMSRAFPPPPAPFRGWL